MVKLSIVMPVYNAEKFLYRSINSILNQTFTDWELILVDDGSKDNSAKICDEFATKDKRIKVLHIENGGSGPARNRGIDVVEGEFIAFPDSDDWMELDAYRICIEKMEETSADLLVFGIRTHIYNDDKAVVENLVEEKIEPVFYTTQEQCRKNYVDLHKKINMNSPCNKIYRRSILSRHSLWFPDLRRMQDCVFNILYYDKIKSVLVIKDNLFNRTWHLAKEQRKKMPDTMLDIAIIYHQTVFDILKKWNKINCESELFFDERFVELLKMIEFDCGYVKEYSWGKINKIIRNINKNAYVQGVLKNYEKNKKIISKVEYAMLHNYNLVLSLYILIKAKKG